MPQNDIASKLDTAKSALAHANASFPPPAPKPAPAPAPASKPAPTPKPPSIADELKVKQANVEQYIKSTPKMHKGGFVSKDGAYRLKKGEAVMPAAMTSHMMKGLAAMSGKGKKNGTK